MQRVKLFSILILSVLLIPAGFAADGTFDNPGFETGDLTGWTVDDDGGNTTFTVTGTAAHAGSWGLDVAANADPGSYEGVLTTIVTGITAGNRYHLNFWFNSDAHNARLWNTRWLDSSDVQVGLDLDESGYISGTGSWEEISRNADGTDSWWEAPTGAAKLQLSFRLYNQSDSGYYYFDEFQLIDLDAATGTETPTPTGDTPTPTPTPEPAEIVINEVFYDSAKDDGCYVELKGPSSTDLTGYSLVGVNGNGGVDYVIINLSGNIPADGYFVVAQDGSVANSDMIDAGVDLQNGSDNLELRLGAVVIDAVGYGDFSGSDVFTGEGNPAPDAPAGNAIARNPDGSDTNDNSVDFIVTSAFSPGENNDTASTQTPVPTVTPAPTTHTIYEIQSDVDGSGDSNLDGTIVTVEGIVTAADSSEANFYIQDGTGPWNAIVVRQSGHVVAIGDEIQVTGEVEEYYNLTEILADTVTILSSGNSLPATEVLTTAAAQDEQWESIFAEIQNVTVSDDNPSGSQVDWEIEDGSKGTIYIYEYFTGITYSPSIDDNLDYVKGVITYTYSNFKLVPRMDSDILVGSLATETPTPTGDTPTPTETPVPADIVINEIYYDSPGGDSGCFVELLGPASTDLTGYTLVGVNGNGGSDYVTISLDGETIPADGYFVIAQDDTVANYDLIDTGVNFQNGPDNAQLRQGMNVVDAIGYGDFSAPPDDHFAGEGTAVAEPLETESLARLPNGVDTNDNDSDFVATNVLTPGEENQPGTTETATPTPTTSAETPTETPTAGPLPQGIFFSEYIEGSSNNKALEIYNRTGSTIDFDAGDVYEIVRFNNGSAPPDPPGETLQLTGTLADGDVFVVANPAADPAILAEADVSTGTITYFNGDDFIGLKYNGVFLDAIGVLGEDPGTNWENNGVATSEMTLVRKGWVTSGDEDETDPFLPDVEWIGYPPDTFDYIGSHDITNETPTPTPSPTAPTHTPTGIPEVTIYDIQSDTDPSGASNYAGQTVIVTGIVTAFEEGSLHMYIQDGTGPWNGILMFDYSGWNGYGRGYELEVTAEVTEYNGMTELTDCSVSVLSTSQSLPAFATVNTGDMGQEMYESVLCELVNVSVSSENPDFPDDFGEWEVDDTSGPARVDDWWFYNYEPTLNDDLDYVRGIVAYANDNFKIRPRDDSDILLQGAPTVTPTPASLVPATGPLGLGILIFVITGILGVSIARKKK